VDRIIILEDLDGFEFEEVCKKIFESLGWRDVRMGPRTSDAGRDIIMVSPEGETVIVECKHHLWRTVGRPVVQKLHSAVIYFGAKKGFLITTGYFSQEAVEYASRLGGVVELIDLRRFKDLADKAGFVVYEKRKDMSRRVLLTYTPEEAVKAIEDEIASMVSRPHAPLQLVRRSGTKLVYRPAYLASYSVYRETYTSTGRLIDVIDAEGSVILDGRTGDPLDYPADTFRDCRLVQSPSQVGKGVIVPPLINTVEAKEKAVDYVITKHTHLVIYRRKNSFKRIYIKSVSPKWSDVKILSIIPLYLPKLELEYSALLHNYKVVCDLAHKYSRLYRVNELSTCTICRKKLRPSKRVLCNECGGIAHFGILIKHAFICESCGKTVCRYCAVRRRKWLIFMKTYCHGCAQHLPQK